MKGGSRDFQIAKPKQKYLFGYFNIPRKTLKMAASNNILRQPLMLQNVLTRGRLPSVDGQVLAATKRIVNQRKLKTLRRTQRC